MPRNRWEVMARRQVLTQSDTDKLLVAHSKKQAAGRPQKNTYCSTIKLNLLSNWPIVTKPYGDCEAYANMGKAIPLSSLQRLPIHH